MSRGSDGLRRLYKQELGALEREATEFAERYPKIASRLRLDQSDEEHRDAHVDRLIQSFAFLSARIRRKLDDDFSELSQALLEILYPQLVRPIPSMAIVELELDPGKAVPAEGVRIPRGTQLRSKKVLGEPLRFCSTAPLTLWPIRVTGVAVTPPRQEDRGVKSVFTVSLETFGDHTFGTLQLDRLRLFLKGGREDRSIVNDLYDLLCAHVMSVEVGGRRLPGSCVTAAGFSEQEAALPYPRRAFPGYRLLQEYFAFPAKFHFFDLAGLDVLRGSERTELEIRFLLDRKPKDPAGIGKQNISLACVPLVNLFERAAHPIPVSPYVSEHPVVPDADDERQQHYEVYSVERVTGSLDGGDEEVIPPFFGLEHGARGGAAYWHPIRRASRIDDATEISLALVNLDLERIERKGTLHVDLVCSDRERASRATKWGQADDFRVRGVSEIGSCRCVHTPTRPLRPAMSGRDHWRLISQLSLNQLSLVRDPHDGEAGTPVLRELLRVYDLTGAEDREIDGILEVRSKPGKAWMHTDGIGSGFVRGVETTITLNPDHFEGSSPLLFASVIERFLALYCSVNSFSRLFLKFARDDKTVVKAWKPRTGERVLL